MRRKHWLILAGLIVVAVLAWLVIGAVVPKTRFVYGVAPVSRDEAVLLTRRNEDDATYFWAELVRSDGSVTWTADLTPFEPHDALGFAGIAATDELVLVFGQREGKSAVVALARATGERLWETAVSDTEPMRIGQTLIVDPPRLLVLHERRRGAEQEETATALSLADGHVLWTLAPAEGVRSRMIDVALLAPGQLLMTSPSGVVAVDTASGQIQRKLPMNWLRCQTPGGVVGTDGLKLVVVPRQGGDGVETPEQIADLGPDSRAALDGPCGVRGDDVVLGLTGARGDNSVGVVRINPVTGKVAWQLELGDRLFERGLAADGRYPRFLPVFVYGTVIKGGTTEKELVVLDLDEGKVVLRQAVDQHMQTLVTAERAYVSGRFVHGLFALDPATGALASATRLDGIDTSDVQAENFRFGQLWLSGMGWGRPADLTWALVDLDSGKVQKLSGEARATDVTADGWKTRR